jgi:hypothetical protein
MAEARGGMGGARRRGRHRCAGRWITAGGGGGGRSRLWFGELVGLLPVSIEEVKGRRLAQRGGGAASGRLAGLVGWRRDG